jgi:tRNA dimethylallyltransferase
MDFFRPLIVILGPTASGKTKLAIDLAKKFSGEIISADSRTIYEGLDIGTAKPTSEERKEVPHFLLDIIKPNTKFSVAEFQRLAFKIIDDIHQKNKIPFLVGGTGLYIDAVTKGFIIPKPKADERLRTKLASYSNKTLLAKLKKLDPRTAHLIDPKNKRRLIRALEVCLVTGRPFSEQKAKAKAPYQILKIGLKLSRQKLYERINQRIDEMIKKGLVRECQKLYEMGFDFNLPSLSGLIYKQMGDYLAGKMSLEEAIELAKSKTRNFARRQMTWFGKDKEIIWLSNPAEIELVISQFLEGNFRQWVLNNTLPISQFVFPVTDFLGKAVKNKIQFGQSYSYSNENGKKIFWGKHLGEDCDLEQGTPVFSIADGLVVCSILRPGLSKDQRNWGNLIIIAHQLENGKLIYSLYGHLKERLVEKGQRVWRSQKIGTIAKANTKENGFWERAHLHFGLYSGPFWGEVLPGYEKRERLDGRLENWLKPSEFLTKVSAN